VYIIVALELDVLVAVGVVEPELIVLGLDVRVCMVVVDCIVSDGAEHFD